ncbi:MULTISPECIES: tape measure protein [unclassified Marinobacter]|uniref:tape measure protein n=1 Tax=unclassified Marinobacter TaxID=83889 RepID=UPI001267CDE9|nr:MULTISPECIES: tape measure protein [unclassified Marinobacter]QFS86626.1 Chromosome partition protein Smc [Marinobacter sp. THAF197a]QFT50410.1 Chromosome partition protein Smc [Marinobacter sp. THAF39]QFT52932.1 Chromosome partition protein Smc [Marinobacter sp. THAF39]
MATNRKGDVELVVSAKNEATQTINELVKSLENLGKEAGQSGIGGLFRKLAKASGDTTKRQDELTDALNRTRQAQNQLQKANDEREKDLQQQRDSIDKTQRSLDRLNAKYREYADEARKARTPSDSLVQTFEKQQRRQSELAQAVDETGRQLGEAQARFEQNQGVDETATRNIEDYRRRVIELGDSWRETTQAVAQAQKVLSQQAKIRDTADAGQKDAQARLDSLRQELKVARELEKEQRRIVREADEATDEQVQAKEEAIAATKRLKEQVEQQVLVEREARAERNASAKSYRDQSREVDKLVKQADKQKTAYIDLKAGLDEYTRAQEKAGTERQQKNIEKLTASLEQLQTQYQGAATRLEKTQERLNKASGPDPRAVQRFENLQQSIKDTEAEIVEQTATLEKMQREYQQAGASADQLAQKERELERVTERLTSEQRELQAETGKTATATDRAGKEAAEAARRFRLWGEDSRQALSWLQRIRGELLSIAAAYGGVYAIGGAVRSIYDASVLTQKATARLAAKFNGDFNAIEQEIRFVREEADRLGIEFETLLEQYTRFVNNVPDGVLNIDQIRFTFTGIAEASRAAGLGTQDIQSVFVALGQIAAKGAVQLEELRQQLGERIPAAIENTAKGLTEMTGELVTTEELLQRINRGEVSSTAIVALAQSLRSEFGPALETALDSPLAALARFRNTLYDIRIEIAKSGFIDQLTQGLEELNKEMRTPEFRNGMREFANALSGVVQFGVLVIKNLDTVTAALKALVAIKAAGYLRSVTAQIAAMSAASLTASRQVKTATTAVGKLRGAVIALYNAVLLLPAAFYAGLTVGDYLQDQYPELRKFGATLVGVFEKSIIRSKETWDTFLIQMEGGWKSVVKEIARAFVTVIPTVIWRSVETVGNAVGLVNESLGKSIQEFAVGSLNEVNQAADGLMDKLLDTTDVDALIAEVRKKADAEAAAVDQIITQMFSDIDKLGGDVVEPEEGKKAGHEYGEEFLQGLRELDYFQTGVNAGKSLGEGLLTQLKNIRDALAEESATGLEDRLKLIEAEFKDFMEGISQFQTEGDQNILEIQEKAQERIGQLRENQNIDDAVRKREIASIEKRAAQEVAQIRESQSLLADAPQVVQQLINIRKEKERQKYIDEQIEKTQNRINGLNQDRQDDLDRVNELAQLGLISTEEQGEKVNQINTEMIGKLKEAVQEARNLAEATGNADLSRFVDQFDNFEEVERRRAALEDLNRLEQRINDQYSIRETKLDTINTLRETGAIDAATAEQRARTILDQSNQTLGEMIDKAITLAEKLGDEGLVANLKNMKAGLQEVKDQLFSGDQLAEDFASGFTNAFNQFIDGTMSMADAFRQFAADFLRQIANMILQQIIFNAVRGAMGGVAGGLNAVVPTNHTGGIVGQDGKGRLADLSWFAGAVRYHSGGIAGLKPNEVPTILEKGEEVLTASDPRHRNNQGSDNQSTGVKIINAIDSSSIVSEGLNSAQGQKAIINFIRANKAQVKSVLA